MFPLTSLQRPTAKPRSSSIGRGRETRKNGRTMLIGIRTCLPYWWEDGDYSAKLTLSCSSNKLSSSSTHTRSSIDQHENKRSKKCDFTVAATSCPNIKWARYHLRTLILPLSLMVCIRRWTLERLHHQQTKKVVAHCKAVLNKSGNG